MQVKEEIMACYELVERLKKGAVNLSFSRVPEDHAHFRQAHWKLSRQVMPNHFWILHVIAVLAVYSTYSTFRVLDSGSILNTSSGRRVLGKKSDSTAISFET
jgi:hypothetical protein